MGLSRTGSEIDGDFSRKSQNFHTPLYFAHPLKEFPLELGVGAGDQKTTMMGYRVGKEVWRYLNTPTWRTDGRTDRHRARAKTALTHSVAR